MLRASVGLAFAFQEQNAPQPIPSGFTAGGIVGGSAQQPPASHSMNALQRVIQAQDSLHARQLSMLVAQGQQPQNGFASSIGQNFHPPGMGLRQGQGSMQPNFTPPPSLPPANLHSSAAPPASQLIPPQPTYADYQALLTSIQPDLSTLTPEAMSFLPRFSHTSGADLEAHRVPSHIVAFMEQHRSHLQRAARDQTGFWALQPSHLMNLGVGGDDFDAANPWMDG